MTLLFVGLLKEDKVKCALTCVKARVLLRLKLQINDALFIALIGLPFSDEVLCPAVHLPDN